MTGLIILENKSLANISRCTLSSADASNISRFLSEAPWQPSLVNQTRIEYLLSQTVPLQRPLGESSLLLDDTLCEHVGSLFDYIDRHYNHSNGTYPLAHNLVTSHYLSGAVRFPVDFAIYRRYEEVTRWESFVSKYFPEQSIPKKAQDRAKLHRQLAPKLLEDPEFARLDKWFSSKIEIGTGLIEQAIERELPFSTVLFDSWFLSPEFVSYLKENHQDWVSLLKVNRNLEA